MTSKDISSLAARRKELVIQSREDIPEDEKSKIEEELQNVQRALRIALRMGGTESIYGLAYGSSALPIEDEQ